MPDPDARHVLIYTYVPDMIDRRDAYRGAHLERIADEVDAGRVTDAGGFDPPTGGLIVFEGVDVGHIEEFVAADPYRINGLVTEYRVERWNRVPAR
ncbi:MAG: hypothetical protein JOZ07_09135 [Solirubrobacterales bacterium]|nr:hypothetical protein [Solirubrobacterales bacterium]